MILPDFIFWFTASATLVLLGVIGLIYWHRAQRLRRLEAEDRAFEMLAQARHEMYLAAELESAVRALEVEWAGG